VLESTIWQTTTSKWPIASCPVDNVARDRELEGEVRRAVAGPCVALGVDSMPVTAGLLGHGRDGRRSRADIEHALAAQWRNRRIIRTISRPVKLRQA